MRYDFLPKPQQAWEVRNPLASPSSNTWSELVLITLLTCHKHWEQKGTFRDMALPAGLLFPQMSCTDIEFRSQDAATGQLLSPAKDSKVHKCQVLEVRPQSILLLFFNELHFQKKNSFSDALSVNLRDSFEYYFLRSGNEQLKKNIMFSPHQWSSTFLQIKITWDERKGDFQLWKWLYSIPGPIKTKSPGLRPDHTVLISQATLEYWQNGGAYAQSGRQVVFCASPAPTKRELSCAGGILWCLSVRNIFFFPSVMGHVGCLSQELFELFFCLCGLNTGDKGFWGRLIHDKNHAYTVSQLCS